MNYLQKKKLAFMSIVNSVKGFIRTVFGVPPLSLPDCVDNDSLINYTIDGNSVQNGEPTPDTPIEVESVGEYDEETGKYKIPVACSGKNLFDKDEFKYGIHMCTVTRNDYNYTIKGSKGTPNAASSGSFQIILPKSVISQTNTFTVSINITMLEYGDINNQIRLWTIENNTAKQNMMSQTFSLNERCRLSWTFTNADYELAGIWFYVNGNKISFEMDTLQIETNDVMTDYEPYYLPVTTNIYLDEPLRKITNSRNGLSFADYIDYEKQQLVRNIYRQHIAIVDSKSSSGNVFLSSIDKRPYQTPSVVDNTTSVIGYAISNTFKQWNREYVIMRLYGGYIMSYITTSGALRVAYTFTDETINTVAKAQTAIGDGFYVYYVLDEPEETPITLPKLSTFKGTTVYTIGTTVQPTNMSATYYATSKE